MQAFFELMSKEFQNDKIVSMDIHPSHSQYESKKGTVNVVSLIVAGYDQYHNLIDRRILRFENDKYRVSPSKRLDHVTFEELDAAYLMSRDAILAAIFETIQRKHTNNMEKLERLNAYVAACQEEQTNK